MDMFYALAEPRRRKIIEMLATNGQMSATEISRNFRISPQAISQHLRILLETRLLRMEKHAQQHIYRVNPDSILELEAWVRQTKKLWDARFDRLDEVLKEENRHSKKTKM
ncbi:MAG: winged helix-turn-helix transcriptional regulator [Candidatus Micrarchaeota archaeon]|nr:winged helix-turn-helix transcriptional regulator [Candidatus Micrarchaeota archaeon]